MDDSEVLAYALGQLDDRGRMHARATTMSEA